MAIKTTDDNKEAIAKYLEGVNEKEIKIILQNLKEPKPKQLNPRHKFRSSKVKIGLITDLHIGNKCFDENCFYDSVRFFKKEKVNKIYCSGDICEGMSNREGHMYELKHYGITAQVHEAKRLLEEYHTTVHGITGNHELWAKYKANQGVDVGDYLGNICDNYINLGPMEADINIGDIVLKLYHGQDGSAYAPGYRGMKLLESLSGGQKPNILLAGHTHKYLNMFQRNVHYVEGGCLESQTAWMRGKKLMAHKGYSVIEFEHDKTGVKSFKIDFHPAYD